MAGQYAVNTDISSDRSRGDIEKTLAKYGGKSFMYGYDEHRAIVQFATATRHVRFVLPMPDRDSRQFTHTAGRNQVRSKAAAAAQYEQAVRQRWRALNLVIKAKLEAVETGIVSFDAEFMAHIVLPDDTTVGESVIPGIKLAYETGQMPELLARYDGPRAIES